MKKILLKYSSNNSGGSWWLEDKDWEALEKAGWTVDWAAKEDGKLFVNKDTGRYMGALATSCEKEGDSVRELLKEFEEVTGQDISDEGCNCCGAPHSFSWEDEGQKYYASGEELLNYLYDSVPASLRDACK